MASLYNDAGKTAAANGTTLVAGTSGNTVGGGNKELALGGTAGVKRNINTIMNCPSDPACYECIGTASGTASYFSLSVGGTTGSGAAGAWMMHPQNPTATIQYLRWGNSGANYIGITTASRLSLVSNSTSVYTTTMALSFKTWYWISHAVVFSSTVGVSKFGIWNTRGQLLETFTTAANQNTSALTGNAINCGKISGTGVIGAVRSASLRATNDNSNLIPPPIPFGVVGWGLQM